MGWCGARPRRGSLADSCGVIHANWVPDQGARVRKKIRPGGSVIGA